MAHSQTRADGSLYPSIKTSLIQESYDGADKRTPCAHCGDEESGSQRWLRRCITLGLWLWMTFGLYQCVTILASLRESAPPSRIDDINPIPCHSHNDSRRPVPLCSAISAGCVSVEVDIWPVIVGGDICVGLAGTTLRTDHTLKRLYIDPLVEILDRQNPTAISDPNLGLPLNGIFDVDASQSFTLLLDFKGTGGVWLWPDLLGLLAPLRSRNYLTYFDGTGVIPGPVTVVCTGDWPFDLFVSNTTYRDVFFEAPLEEMWEASGSDQEVIPEVDEGSPGEAYESGTEGAQTSTNQLPANPDQIPRPVYSTNNSYYASTSFLETIGRTHQLSPRQLDMIRGQIRGAHRRGLKVRYRDLPDWPVGWRNHAWEVLFRDGIDVLIVDDLKAAAKWNWGRGRG